MMTDRTNSLIVVLEQDLHTDDAESIINALKMVKGVLSVEANISNITDHIAKTRAKYELLDKLSNIIKDY